MIRHSKPNIKRTDLAGVLSCMVTDNIADGSTLKEFEQIFASLFGFRSGHAVAVSSGTVALTLGLRALGVGPGDEVILPSYVCAAPYHAVIHCGATPVLCDIGPDYNISAAAARGKITERTKAVIAAHLFGQPADLDALLELGVPLVEDCAQALGARYKGEMVGGFGKFSFFSFYATKMITTGYGGMLVTRDLKLAGAVRAMRYYDKKESLEPAGNAMLSDFQAAMGINQLKRLDHFIELRRKIAEVYNRRLLEAHFEVPAAIEGRENVYYRYPVRVKRSLKDAIEFLRKHTIEAAPPVFRPLHRYLELPAEDFPESEQAFLKTLSIPIYPALLNREVEHVAKVTARSE